MVTSPPHLTLRWLPSASVFRRCWTKNRSGLGDEIVPTLQIRSTKQAMHAEFGCLMWFGFHITFFSISPLKVIKLLPSLTYLKIFPSQTLSFVPHSAQFHVTALTELAKRSTNNYTKKNRQTVQVYLCAIPGTMNIKILLSLSSCY